MTSIYTVKMPDIGEGVVEGEVVSWLKQVGDELKQDEPVVIVMTDKATVELPSPYPGKLAKQHYKVGEVAVKDQPLYDIALEKPVEEQAVVEAPQDQLDDKIQDKPSMQARELLVKEDLQQGKALASPAVRKLAKEMHIDLSGLHGSGKDGRILREDLHASSENAAKGDALHLLDDEETPLVGIHNLMAKKMALSKKMIPHFSFFDRADAELLLDFYKKMKKKAEEKNIRLTIMPFFIKALSKCLIEHPLANSSLDESKNSIIVHKQHNIGIAMSTSLGLIVPVIKSVQDKNLFDVIYAYDELKQKARQNQLSSKDMQQATITITNFGALGNSGVFATPIINYPEAAILGLAHIHLEPSVWNGQIQSRSVLNCSWSFDHRIIDGDEASKISYGFKKLIENPAMLLD